MTAATLTWNGGWVRKANGKIEPRRKTGACLKHQRLIATAVKRARHLALLPYTLEHVRQTGVFPTRG